jgi:hypothetical protein
VSSFSDFMSSPYLSMGSPIEEKDPIMFAGTSGSPSKPTIALTGTPNNPSTPSGSNSPGLGASLSPQRPMFSTGGTNVSKKWIWIVLIIVALFAAYYLFFQPGAAGL